MATDVPTMGLELRRLRRLNNLTMLDASKVSGLSLVELSHAELNEFRPTDDQLRTLAKCYGSDAAELIELAKLGEADIEAKRKENAERLAKAVLARFAIVEHLGGPWKPGMPERFDQIGCPACGDGILHFCRSGFNGHIRAKCSTEGCVSWME